MLKIIFTSFFCICSIRIKFIVFYEWILLINNFLLMKTLPFKKANMFTDHKNRIYFSDTEIFDVSYLIMKQTKFSNKLLYFSFKRSQHSSHFTSLKNYCLLSGYSRSVFSRAKFSRIALSRRILEGSMPGFYKSV